MRSLTEVFAPGTPTLPEGLRTLAVSPDRELEPGMTVRATFTFRNQGGAPATGVRVRFNVPEGLVYLVGSGELDGTGLDDDAGNSPLLSRSGAHIGDVLPGEERRIDIAYSVAGAIENGSTVELQAAVASFEVPPVGSNVVRLVARSRPQLQNALTNIHLDARQDAAPGSEVQVLVRIHNAGESSAHDVVVVAPIPAHTQYVPNSVRVNGREMERELGASFDRVHAPIVVASLGASATATLLYRARIADPLPDGTAIVAGAQVASQETPSFALEPVSIAVASEPDFSDERTALTVEPAHDVAPGTRVTLRLVAANVGTAAAESVVATLDLPDGVLPVRGASRVDGRPIRERKKDALSFDLGRIDKHESVELLCEAVIASPLPHGQTLPIALTLAWEPKRGDGMRRFERAIAVRSEPYVARRRNAIARNGAERVRPGDEVEATVVLANDGSAALADAALELRSDDGLDELRVYEKSARLTLDEGAIALGALEAYGARRLTVRARVRSPLADRRALRLGAVLRGRDLPETPLGEAVWETDSHPVFASTTSRIGLASEAVLRPNQLADAYVRVRNDGSDTAHAVRVRLYISPEARLETVEGATRERSSIAFGELAPGASAEARLGLRLLRGMAKTYPVTVDAVLTADAMLPVPLERLTIETTAEPAFGIGSLRSDPADAVDVGEAVEWTLHVRNGGDGPARRVQISVEQPASLIYVPNSCTVNDLPVRDVGALSAVASERGIVLNDVDPGVEATIRWRDVVHNGLPAGEAIARVARIVYDGDRTDELVAADLHVRSAPAFANTIPGLPFGVDGMLGPAFGASARAISGERFVELPAATPVGESRPMVQSALHDDLPAAIALDAGPRPATLLAFSAERVARTRRLLDEAPPLLAAHLFAIRALLPDAIGDGRDGAIRPAREALRESLDMLFIKLRVPGYPIAARDLETPTVRAAIERLATEAGAMRGTPADPHEAALILRGEVDVEGLADATDELSGAPLGSAAPWYALAHLLPNSTPPAREYREALLRTLASLAGDEPAEFLDALGRPADAALDAALAGVRRSCF